MGLLDAPPEVRAVLDHTALQSYARGQSHVGELIREIADEENAFLAIPSVALLEAYARTIDDPPGTRLLNYLVTLPGAMVLDLELHTVSRAAGHVRALLGNVPRAHAAWAAMTYEALCVTAEPEAYPEQVLQEQVVAIPTKDA
jgi:hypothetical protein